MRMRAGIFAILGLLLAAVPVAAQEAPKVEIAGGYSYVRANLIPDTGCCFGMNGGTGSIAYNLNDWLGLVGELGGYHTGDVKSTGFDLTVVSYLFGPQLSYRRSDRFTPFAHLLLGGAHAGGSLYTGTASVPGPGSQNGFAMAAGGGFDLNVSPHLAIRLIQADYSLTRFSNGVNHHQNNLRLTFGVVFRFGKR
jgi:outer membrane immunogenic protein